MCINVYITFTYLHLAVLLIMPTRLSEFDIVPIKRQIYNE